MTERTMDSAPKLYEHERHYQAMRDAGSELYEALEKCRYKFAEYAEMHRAKIGTKDANTPAKMDSVLEKVERNLEMVRLCDAALAKARGDNSNG